VEGSRNEHLLYKIPCQNINVIHCISILFSHEITCTSYFQDLINRARHRATLQNYKVTWTSLLTNEKAKSTVTRRLFHPNHPPTWVMVSMLTQSVVYRGLKSRLGQTKDYKIDICCFSTKHVALRSKNKDWLASNNTIKNTENKLYSTIWWWCPHCIWPTCLIGSL
jgi:hypothetical protein